MKHILQPIITVICGLLLALPTNAQCNFNPSDIPTAASCFGGSDGAINLSVSGGPTPFTYLWSNAATTEDISSLAAGTYTVTITDAVGCTMTHSRTITQPAAFLVNAQSLTLTCVNLSGNTSVSVANGTAPYAWQLSNGATGTTTSAQFNIGSISAPGSYNITVTNANGCSNTDQFDVTQDILPPVANAGPDIVLTCLTTSVSLNGSGSSTGAMFSYVWTGPGIVNGPFTLNPIINQPGVYILIVTNTQNGCTATDQVVVTGNFAPPIITVLSQIGIPCVGGSITMPVSVSGAPNTTFLWLGPNNFTSSIESPTTAVAGVYTLVATNTLNGCTASKQITVYSGPAIPPQNFTVTDLSCAAGSTGGIDLDPNFGTGPYTFAWSNGATTEDLSNLNAGTYTVTVTDASSCNFQAFVVVKQLPSNVVLSTVTVPVLCFGGNSGSIDLTVTGGTAPYTYNWNNSVTTQDLQNLQAATYCITVTDAIGCTANTCTTLNAPSPIITSLVELSNTCDAAAIQVNAAGGVLPYTYSWAGSAPLPNVTQNIIVNTSDNYQVTVTDANGCTKIAAITVTLANGGACGYVRGSVIQDDDKDCIVDTGEPGLSGWLVRAEGLDTLYGITDANGKYLVSVPAGTYQMAVLVPNNLWQVCPLLVLANVAMQNDTAFGGNFPVKAEVLCPALSVSIGTQQLRRCFSNNYYNLHYCNDGTALAENAYIDVLFDPFLSFESSAIPSQIVGNNKRRFFIGNVGIGDCGNFSIKVSVNCTSVLGQAHCTEAHIFPDTLCNTNMLWSGASLAVRSVCNTDSIQFVIKNVGNGNMTSAADYIVVEDAVMLMQAPVPLLQSGDSITLKFPANGSTWRVEVDQEVFHPYPQPAALSIEGCTTSSSFSTGFVNQFPISDYGESIDIDCTANIGSYDPNDKQGYPLGYGAAHYVRPGTEIEYLIRFQNTGTDTAFTVRIIDTLSMWLDPATVKFGASSHPYRYDLCGEGIVHLIFEDILLPDSNVNEVASHGFVKFKVTSRSNALLESVIENSAAIYFDFNDPIITNTTFHRLGENFVTVGLWQPRVPGAQVIASPNPFSEETLLEVKGLKNTRALRLQVFDFQGNEIRTMESEGNTFRLKKGGWPAGIYFFKITQQGKIVGSGKLIAQ